MADQQDLRTPAHRFRQGGRDVYACVLDLPALNTRLPDRVDDRVVKEANRQLTPSHARRIQTYLAERKDWVLSALMLGVPREAVAFRPYVKGDDAPMQVGELRIPRRVFHCYENVRRAAPPPGHQRRNQGARAGCPAGQQTLRPAGMLAPHSFVCGRRHPGTPADVCRCCPDQDHRSATWWPGLI